MAVDTETTALTRPHLDGGRRIWEVGAIRVNPGGSQDVLHVFVDLTDLPVDPDAPGDSRESLQIGGFFTRHPQVGKRAEGRVVREAELAELVMELFAPDPHTGERPHLVGCVPSFEDQGLADLLFRHGHITSEPPWHHRLVCAETAAAAALRTPPRWEPRDLARRLGLDPAAYTPHQALEDARFALDLYQAALTYEGEGGSGASAAASMPASSDGCP